MKRVKYIGSRPQHIAGDEGGLTLAPYEIAELSDEQAGHAENAWLFTQGLLIDAPAESKTSAKGAGKGEDA